MQEVSRHETVELPWYDLADAAVCVSQFLLLVGSAGCGKHTWVESRCEVLDSGEPLRLQAAVLGTTCVTDDGHPIRQALHSGRYVLVEGMDADDAWKSLLSCMVQIQQFAALSQNDVHEHFRIIVLVHKEPQFARLPDYVRDQAVVVVAHRPTEVQLRCLLQARRANADKALIDESLFVFQHYSNLSCEEELDDYPQLGIQALFHYIDLRLHGSDVATSTLLAFVNAYVGHIHLLKVAQMEHRLGRGMGELSHVI